MFHLGGHFYGAYEAIKGLCDVIFVQLTLDGPWFRINCDSCELV